MRIKILINLLLCCTINSIANADILGDNLQKVNQSQLQNQNSLWQRMRDGFALEHRQTKEVLYWEKRYGNPKYFNIIMQNAAPYLYFVVTEMERRGIPLELALIPIVESTYNPNAVSPAAVSTGMWQFLAGSGKRFGMTINSDLDERKDIVKSTRGAITYLQYLHDLFGSWELAIAAYNWGEGNINNAVNSANSKDFYSLDVRDVTKQYIPKVIALASIIQNPERFGIKLTNLPNRPYFAITYPPSSVAVSDFMNQANMDATVNKKLNPQYNSLSYSVSSNQRMLLPISNQPTYLASIGGKAGGDMPTIPATVAPIMDGNNNDPVAQAAPANNSSDPIGALIADQQIDSQKPAPQPVISNNAVSSSTNNENVADILDDKTSGSAITSSNPPAGYSNYTVAQGDTLYSISKKFAVSIDQLKSDNQISDSGVKLNQQLLIRNQPNS